MEKKRGSGKSSHLIYYHPTLSTVTLISQTHVFGYLHVFLESSILINKIVQSRKELPNIIYSTLVKS